MDPARWTWRDPQQLEVLTREQCRDLLASVRVARVALCDEDTPTVLPINHVVDAWTAAFRTTFGSKLSAAVKGRTVAVQADGWDAEGRTGWSVLARGAAEHVTDAAVLERLDGLGLDVWANGVERVRWIRVPLDELSGRRIPPRGDGS